MEALRALIHAANVARDKGLAAVPDGDMAPDLALFRNAVRVRLSNAVEVGEGAKYELWRPLGTPRRGRGAG